MPKKVIIVINLQPEASKASTTQIEERVRNEAIIPWCKNIEEVTIEDVEASYTELRKYGISSNVAQNLVDLYTE